MSAGIDLRFRIGDRVMHESAHWFGRLSGLSVDEGAVYATVDLAEPIVIPAESGAPIRIHKQSVPLHQLRRGYMDEAVYELACSMAQELQELLDVGQAEHPERYEATALVLEDWHRVHHEMFRLPITDPPPTFPPAESLHIAPLTDEIPGVDDIDDQLDERIRLPFDQLNPDNQQRAAASFLGAYEGDGYLYELDADEKVLCRRKDVSA